MSVKGPLARVRGAGHISAGTLTDGCRNGNKRPRQGYEKAGEVLKRLTDELAQAERDRAEKTAEAELQFRTACKESLADGKLTVR